MSRNYRAETTVLKPAPSAQQLIGSVLSLIGEDIRVAAALDIEAAIQLRIQAERDALKALNAELVVVLKAIQTLPDQAQSSAAKHLADVALAKVSK